MVSGSPAISSYHLVCPAGVLTGPDATFGTSVLRIVPGHVAPVLTLSAHWLLFHVHTDAVHGGAGDGRMSRHQ